jgi:pSer/pThr/pTyr-binding forkhead associated (FHA) protein
MDPASRPRFVVVYQDRRLPLPDGEFVVGRALGCHIRFNAAEVSRQHVKLQARGGKLIAENMSSTTGTFLNGRKMTGSSSLRHGDELTLGPRKLRIEVEDAIAMRISPDTGDSEDGDADEQTRPGSLAHGLEEPGATPIEFHTCPKCRTRVDFGASVCDACGYVWSATHPSAVTGRITLKNVGVDLATLALEVPVVYASEELTLDAVVGDLGAGRAFVPSPLLDPVGTTCELTLLPDGIHAMNVAGVVTSVRATADAGGPGGMEVRFTDVPATVRNWIDRWMLARSVSAGSAGKARP